MNTKLWGVIAILALGMTLMFSVAAGSPNGDETVKAEPTRGKPVKVNGKDMKLWVFVHHEKGGKGKPPPTNDGPSAYCDDVNQGVTVPKFANASPNGLTFNINYGSIPLDKTSAIGAVHDSFGAWDSVSGTASDYFTVNDAGGAARPNPDGNNTVGWVRIVPRTVLAATWSWTDGSGAIVETDVFYNSDHKWAVLAGCDSEGKFDVGNIGTHEFGHVVGLDHLSDPGAYATMYPSASKGEIRKRTLTDGDKTGYLAAGGY